MTDYCSRQAEYQRENFTQWREAIRTVFGDVPPKSATWTHAGDIVRVLAPLARQNHALLPDGGGLDVIGVSSSRERHCIELQTTQESAIVARPRSMQFEYIESSPENSFFLIELDHLPPTEVYENSPNWEQLVELDDEYLDYDVWQHGVLSHDENGNEIRLPEHARIVVRARGGKILVVAKTGLWNGTTSTYDGRHERMSAAEIRSAIERAL